MDGSPAPLDGKLGWGAELWLLFRQPGSPVRLEPPDADRVMDASGQRICFQPLFSTTSTCAGFVHAVYEASAVVKPVAVTEKPEGLRGPRARSARTPSTNSSRPAVPAGTLAR